MTFFGAAVVPVGWPHADHMRRITSRVFEAGHALWHESLANARNLSGEYRRDQFHTIPGDGDNWDGSGDDGSPVAPFTLFRFAGAFGALLSGCVLAGLAVCCERSYHRQHV